jgi:hypothetical protein
MCKKGRIDVRDDTKRTVFTVRFSPVNVLKFMTYICTTTEETFRSFYYVITRTYQLRVICVITEMTICENLRAVKSLFRSYKRIIVFENSIL